MSTISFTAAAPVAMRAHATTPAPVTRLRITPRGRRVLAFIVAFPLLVALALGAMLTGGSALASLDGGAPAGTFETYTVGAGDTLWGIATDVAPGVDPRDVIAEISVLNNLGSAELAAGQTLAIPAEYSAAE